MRSVSKSKLFRFLRSLAVGWLALVLIVGVWQRSFIYFPSHAPENVLLANARDLRLEPWRDTSSAVIGWKTGARPDRPPAANRMVVFHGNAGYALHRAHYIAGFEQLDAGRTWEVYVFEYPGYGARPGELGEKSFTTAALAALSALAAADPRPIYLLGESIGSGPACAIAGREPQRVAGLCLLTPFARLGDVASHHYPFLPVGLILRDRWENVAALRGYTGRLAMRLAAEDEIIPMAQGRSLFDRFAGPKRLWIESGAHHNGLDFEPSNPWWREASDFLLGRASPAAAAN
ncbi:MAG: uncharacterized protein QOE70_3098 [Chthoniobacter sp.]|jgi:pimeloyl-ACP methyl ester carboxylesterase|nr:uncharacterized protein [Chthoniobacter sp.]